MHGLPTAANQSGASPSDASGRPITLSEAQQERIQTQLRIWQEKLLDVTKRNPLLGLNRSRVSKLQVSHPSAVDLFQRLVLDESEVKMPFVRRTVVKRDTKEAPQLTRAEGAAASPTEESREIRYEVEPGDVEFRATPAEIHRRLRRVYDNARTTVEERGVTTLYLTFGTLVWQDQFLGESMSPLWMVPCQLSRKGPNVALRLSMADEEMQLNPALTYYLRERHKIMLPELPAEPEANSLSAYLDEVRRIVREHGWNVSEDVWLSTFTFESIVIYQDLKSMTELALTNPFVATLARSSEPRELSEALGDNLDEMPTPDVVPVPILPTDSSQLEALTNGVSGQHLVIHGPPGTGKSQTISNLIADALGRKKKVLFVSAKMAALNVVFQRLKNEGLGEFCLEAHSTKAGKMKVIDELRRCLELEEVRADAGSLAQELEKLRQVRQRLNEYVHELHRKVSPLGVSVYQGIGYLEKKLKDAPDIRAPLPWSEVLSVKSDELSSCLEVLSELQGMARVFDGQDSHPWRGFAALETDASRRELLEDDFKNLLNAVTEVLRILENLQPLAGTSDALSLSQISDLSAVLEKTLSLEKLPDDWWATEPTDLRAKAALFRQAAGASAELRQNLSVYHQYSDLPFLETKALLEPAKTVFNKWYRSFTPAYWSWKRLIRSKLKRGCKKDFRTVCGYFTLATRLEELDAWLREHAAHLAPDVAHEKSMDPKSLAKVAQEYSVAVELREIFSALNLRVGRISDLNSTIRHAVVGLVSFVRRLSAELGPGSERIDQSWPSGFVDGRSVKHAGASKLAARINEVLNAPTKLREWVLMQRILKHCEALGLGPFLANLRSHSAERCVSAFEQRFYKLWVASVIERCAVLVEFGETRYHELATKMRILDERIRRLSKEHARATASEGMRRIRAAQDTVGGQVGILRRELQKKRRIKPLRKLFAEIPNVLQVLKPCMLMSPISVSTYLIPGVFEFDTVVFDEASQLPTAEGIAAVLRAKQVIVAGDPNQLPPTSFFEASLLSEDEPAEDEEYQPLESLLDDCVAVVPFCREAYLRWHYRSRDERLINFSNHYFYNNRLTTFPPPFLNKDGQGVRLAYVSDGVWDRGRSRTNRTEARRVAQLVREHFGKYPERSIGIVAMNTYQREAIEDAIHEELQDRPDLLPLLGPTGEEPFFVKSLESVQGDERDTIIISVGYGRDANGALTMNFGPLNMEGGWRRLNVLVTRARWQTILVTSLRSQDLRGVNPQNRGAVSLRNYIEYAERNGSLPEAPAVVTGEETNDFEDAVREVLLERGYQVDPQVGASRYRIDLGVRDPRDLSRYLIGVECDGATYHSSRTARDRDLLREEILRKMGWRLHRVWSVEWFHNREDAIQSMLRSIEQAKASGRDQSIPAPPLKTETSNPGRDTLAPTKPTLKPASRTYGMGYPYKRFLSGKRGDRKVLLKDSYRFPLAEDIASIVNREGPLHRELVLERLKELHKVERAGSNIEANFRNALRSALRRKRVMQRSEKEFIWPVDRSLSSFRTPGDGVSRTLELIPREEIELAVLFLVEDQFGMIREYIPQSAARLLGIERLTGNGADRIRDLVDRLIEKGLLRASGHHVYVP